MPKLKLMYLLTLMAAASCGGGGSPQPQNTPPLARLGADASSGAVPLVVTFDASASSDADGQILQFQWDFDGDGVVDRATQTAVTSFSYSAVGVFSARLRVTDDGGLTAETTLNVTTTSAQFTIRDVNTAANNVFAAPVAAVVAGRPAVAYALDPERILYQRAEDVRGLEWGPPQEIDLEGGNALDLTVVGGNPAILYARKIGPPGNTTNIMIYSRGSEPAGGTFSGANVDNDLNVTAGGARLHVTAGAPVVIARVTSNGAEHLVLKRALDSEGSDWSSPLIDIATLDDQSLVNSAIVDGRPAVIFTLGDTLFYARASNVEGTLWPTPTAVISSFFFTGKVLLVDSGSGPLVVMHGGDGGDPAELVLFTSADPDGAAWEIVPGIPDFNEPFVEDAAVINGLLVLTLDETDSEATKLLISTSLAAISFDLRLTAAQDGAPALVEVNGRPAIAFAAEGTGQLLFSTDAAGN